jgi:hypothetical protein
MFARVAEVVGSVPSAVLEPPEAFASRGFDRHESALVLDRHLRRLAAQDARGRVVLGRLAAAFLRRRGRGALGFARLGDYARERLGMSGREMESLASVARHLAGLPQLAAAFERGELSWAHVRLLAPVVRPQTQRQWVSLAGARTVRALEAILRARPRPVGQSDPDAPDETTARFGLPCPRRVIAL